jgi:class 3 adenylate cyclase
MQCSKCGAENAAGARFCNQCAAPLSRRCPKCNFENGSEAKFCSQCATPLVEQAPLPVASRATIPAPQTELGDRGLSAERRHLTVLFGDLVGSTEIAARLDPEEWRETVAGYHRATAETITRYGGHVAKYLGDGVMAFFGYPEAHDNDAERAVRAGLAMLDAIAKLNERAPPPSDMRTSQTRLLGSADAPPSAPSPMSNNGGGDRRPKLTARVGIDSGAVVVGAGASKEADVFGEAPNIAARAQAAAEPGTVLITDAVHRLAWACSWPRIAECRRSRASNVRCNSTGWFSRVGYAGGLGHWPRRVLSLPSSAAKVNSGCSANDRIEVEGVSRQIT